VGFRDGARGGGGGGGRRAPAPLGEELGQQGGRFHIVGLKPASGENRLRWKLVGSASRKEIKNKKNIFFKKLYNMCDLVLFIKILGTQR
jgi:uracil-DNA glycosylase